MSGGSLNYVFSRINDAAELLSHSKLSYRRAFAKHLELISDALYKTEWAMSGDTEEGSEKEAIMACISPLLLFNTVIDEATRIRDELNEILKKNKK